MSTSDLKKLYAASLRWSGEYWTGITTLDMSLLGQAGSAANVVDDVAGQGFDSFSALKKYLGSPGKGNEWHHIVEQSQITRSNFTSQMINNTDNVIAIDATVHRKISGFYSSKTAFSEGMTVRDWLAGQSFEKQFEFGMKVLRDFGVIN